MVTINDPKIQLSNLPSGLIEQCVCDWDGRDSKFVEVEGIIKRQIKVLTHYLITLQFSMKSHTSVVTCDFVFITNCFRLFY